MRDDKANTLLVALLQHVHTMRRHPCLRGVDTASRSCFLTGVFSRLKCNRRYLSVHFFFIFNNFLLLNRHFVTEFALNLK